MNFAGRGMEVKAVLRSDLRKIIGDDGVAMYKGQYHRSKMTGAADTDEQYFFVTGELEIKCLDHYLSLFKADDTNDSLWRQVLQDSGNPSKWYMGKQNVGKSYNYFLTVVIFHIYITYHCVVSITIGKNTIAHFGKEIALAIGWSEKRASEVTGHFLRRTATTLAANGNLSMMQLQALTGHKSQVVLAGYVATSDPMREIISESLAFSDPPAKRQRTEEQLSPTLAAAVSPFMLPPIPTNAGHVNIVYNFTGATFSGGALQFHN